MFRRKTPTVITDEVKIDEVLSRGVEEIVGEGRLREALRSGRRLRIKLGIDPTSPHLHLGRTVPLLKLRDFQELGHQVVFIVGDFTGVIGDTSDKESERPMLARDDIESNKRTYLQQVGKIIDIKKAEFRYNSEWLRKLGYGEIGEHADQFSVADFIARDNIKRRLDAGKRVSLREVLYPLMQGYDSVAVEADVEIGGVDQRFNLLAGRTLQEHFGQEPQALVMTTFPIEGTDGRKMSSSWGNTINLTAPPDDMFGKVMRVNDDLIAKYFTVLTRVPEGEVKRVVEELEAGANPRDAKLQLAREIVALYHGDAAAVSAAASFAKTFSERGVPEDVPVEVAGKGEALCVVLERAGVVASRSECRRLVEQGAVRNAETDEKINDPAGNLTEPVVLKVGKRRFLKIELS